MINLCKAFPVALIVFSTFSARFAIGAEVVPTTGTSLRVYVRGRPLFSAAKRPDTAAERVPSREALPVGVPERLLFEGRPRSDRSLGHRDSTGSSEAEESPKIRDLELVVLRLAR